MLSNENHESLMAGGTVTIQGVFGPVELRFMRRQEGKRSHYMASMVFPGNTLRNHETDEWLPERAVEKLYAGYIRRRAVEDLANAAAGGEIKSIN